MGLNKQIPKNYDVIVIGGGVNGAAIARDATLRGLKTLLLEAKDFASGASGHNGRMIHGGLRYLASGDIGLVIEALRERRILRKIAPHLVKESTLLIPMLKNDRHTSWMVGLGLLGLTILDLGRHPRSKWLSNSQILNRVPSLRESNLKGAFEMYDAYAKNAERLTIENVLSASEAGADVRNHAPVTEVSRDGNDVLQVTWQENGLSHRSGAKTVVNSTGAWIDEFLARSTGKNGGLITKAAGSFVIVKPTANAPTEAVFVTSKVDGRPVLVTPWFGNLLIGTTDRVVSSAIDDVKTTRAEIDYLFDTVDQAFAPGTIRREDTLFTYCGVRPLPFSNEESRKTTRKHVIHKHSGTLNGLISVFGGKLSTFRSLAEDVTDEVLKSIGRSGSACQTAQIPLPGAQNAELSTETNQSTLTLDRLKDLYGARAGCILKLARKDARLAEVVDPETGAIAGEFVHAVRDEFAQTLSDVFLRRTLLGYRSDRGKDLLTKFGTIAKVHLGWSNRKIAADVEEYLQLIEGQAAANSQKAPVASMEVREVL